MAGSLLIVAGEASADEHGAHVLRALRRENASLQAFGVGGAALRAAGLEAVAPAEAVSVAGLTEVICALPRLWRIMGQLTRRAAAQRPSAAVLIDLPDFNLRLARRLRRLGIPVIYYISPQVWAWRQSRVDLIREVVAQMLVILPFEAEFYARHRVPVRFVGHPLVEQLAGAPAAAEARLRLGLPAATAPLVALLPGSRRKEVTRHLPAMLAALAQLRGEGVAVRGVLPVASTIPRALVERLVAASAAADTVTIVDGEATAALAACDAAVVCSGTATLQAALLQRPMVVVYRVSWLSFQILRRLIKVAHIALVNLIAGERLVCELVQGEVTPQAVARELRPLLRPSPRRTELLRRLAQLREGLGRGDTAAAVAAAVTPYLARRSAS